MTTLETASGTAVQEAAGYSLCPNCEHGRMKDFYEVRNIPVHSVLLMPTQERALNYPRRNLRLGFCEACGFVSNTVFDPTVHEYSTSCEESQGFSPTFNAFSKSLAKRWVDQYGLHGKSVLEIGCGKGEFLAQLVECGMSRGIGIDPAYVPERLATPVADRLEFIQDLYSEKYTHLEADVICCRHTLEHIAPTGQFLRMLRRTIGNRRDILLLFELPDVFRVLKEAAFWDIYYEHCSYFTKESLAHLFRRTGFDVLELELEYDDQYIVIAGKPSAEVSERNSSVEAAEIVSVASEVASFPARFAKLKTHWLSILNGLRAEGKKVVVWGGGSKAVSFLTTLGITDQVDFVVDINPYKHGKFVPGAGHAVKSPHALAAERPDTVILMNPIYEREVRSMLAGMGLNPHIYPV